MVSAAVDIGTFPSRWLRRDTCSMVIFVVVFFRLGLPSLVNGLAVGSKHACVVLDDGSVKCFGQNGYGQLGQGDTDARGNTTNSMGDALEPVDLGSGATVTAMSAGSDHTCAVLSDGTLKCFGRNNKGQLGLGDVNNRGDEQREMGDNLLAVYLGENRTAVSVAAEGDRTCVLLDTGNVRCWGDGEFGGLGNGGEGNTGDGNGVIDEIVSTGGYSVAIGEGPCVVTEEGNVKCWGKGYYGKNGQGAMDSVGDDPGEMGAALEYVPLGAGRLAHSVTGGRDYVCALLQDGYIKCWGRGEGGQLGTEDIATLGDDPDETEPLSTIDLGTGVTAVEVTTGQSHTCALLETGAVKCWGRNFFGNLGLEDFKPRGHERGTMGNSLPELDLGTGRTVLTVKAGEDRTCAILDDGSLKCWGDNAGGILGLGDSQPRGQASLQMGDNLQSVSLGKNRTAVALGRTELPTRAPTYTPTSAPTPSPTTRAATIAPTAVSTTLEPTRTPTLVPITVEPTTMPVTVTDSPIEAPTMEPVVPLTPVPTAASTLDVIADADRDMGSDGDNKTTLIASVAAPVGILLLLGGVFMFAKRRNAAQGPPASVASKTDVVPDAQTGVA